MQVENLVKIGGEEEGWRGFGLNKKFSKKCCKEGCGAMTHVCTYVGI